MTLSSTARGASLCLLTLALTGCTYARLLTARPVIAHDAEHAAYTLNGPITFGTADQLARQVPAGATLRITSPGGRSEVARKIVEWANARDIRIVIVGSCMSACANTLTAARNLRFEAPVALLFHGAGQDAAFYRSAGRNPEFVAFADRAATERYQARGQADGRRKLYGVAVPYFWVPTADELRCFGVEAPVRAYADFKPEARASGMYFTTADLSPGLQQELQALCARWPARPQ